MLTQKLLLKNKKKSSTLTEIISPSGRRLYRHSSGMGTVMCFNDGQDREILVLDAAYRGAAYLISDTSANFSLPDYNNPNINNNWYIHGIEEETTPTQQSSLTDETINSLWINTIDCNTAKYNCDTMITEAPDTSDNITICKNILVDGNGCDIPNFQTLQRIYCEAELLDSLDPTISIYPDNALGSANPYGVFAVGGENNFLVYHNYGIAGCWSSTDGGDIYGFNSALFILSNGYCGNDQIYIPPLDYYINLGIIPVLELT